MLVECDEVTVDIMGLIGLTGVEINQRIKLKSVGVIFEVGIGIPFLKEIKSWLSG